MAVFGSRFTWRIESSGMVSRRVAELQAQALEEGRGMEFNQAVHLVLERLRLDPTDFGEPFYRLAALRLQIRVAAVLPLAIQFGVAEEDWIVYIRDVRDMGPKRRR